MKELFYNYIDWDNVGEEYRDRAVAQVDDAVILSEKNILKLSVRLNYVVPAKDEDKIKGIILNSVGDLKDVEFEYTYVNLILSDADALRIILPKVLRKLNEKNHYVAGSIDISSLKIEGKRVIISTVGELACKNLNGKASSQIALMIKNEIGLEYEIVFENDDKLYAEAHESLQKRSDDEIKELNEKTKEAAKAAASKPKAEEQKFQGGGNSGFRRKKNTKDLPAKGNIIMGEKAITLEITPLAELSPEQKQVAVAGILFDKNARTVRHENVLMSLSITDRKTSTCLKTFVSKQKWDEINSLLKEGTYIKAIGAPEWDTYENAITVRIDGIEKSSIKLREDNYDGQKRVELHCHTKMSAMDGLNDVETIVKTAARWGHPAVAITDHGVVQSFPDAASAAAKLAKDDINIKIIYGMEGYVFDDSDCVNEDGSIDYKKKGTNHIILLAATQEGLKNIYKMVSMSHIEYFYRKPRLPKSVISKYRDGVIIGSACEAGEVYRAVSNNLSDAELDEIASFYDYLEIQPLINNQFMIEKRMVESREDLRNFNRRVLECGRRLGKMVVATTDAHYDEPESAIFRNIIMAGMGYKDAENGQGLYMRTTEEMLEEFSYLGDDTAYEIVVENPNKIADMISPEILPVPKGKYPPKIEGAEETLRKTCMDKVHEMYGENVPSEIEERLNKELDSIIGNGYAVMYVSAQMLVNKSLEDGYLVGSRGSVGSSLAATMAGITEVNPLEPHYVCPKCKHLEWGDMNLYDCGIDMPVKACPKCGTEMKRDGFTIPFATFLGFNGDKEPDIDLNFAGEYQARAHSYVGEIFGEKNVYKAGTVSTVADKTAYGYVLKFAEEKNFPINKFDTLRLAKGCTGVKKTTGQHPGGIVIVPEDHEIYEFCPVQRPANDAKSDVVTTHFDYHKIDQNLLKLDILGHNVPSMIRQLQDMTGVDPLQIDLTDRKVLSIFNGTEALDIKDENYKFTHGTYAIPEFGTSFVRQMLDDTKPDKFADLVRISGFSHGTDVWLNNAQDYIKDGTATMREVISTRDDIMNYLILKGIENKTSFDIMEKVRKNKPLSDELLGIMKDHGVPDWYIDSCIKIQYMFPRAHAVAYTMMSFRMAWYKVYYPQEFYATHFTSVAADFNASVILQGPSACLNKIEETITKGKNATPKEMAEILVYEVAYEMYARGFKFRMPKLGHSKALKFWVEDGEVLLPFVVIDGMGGSAATAFVEAYEEKPFDTVEDAVIRSKVNRTALESLRAYGIFDGLPETDQLSFF